MLHHSMSKIFFTYFVIAVHLTVLPFSFADEGVLDVILEESSPSIEVMEPVPADNNPIIEDVPEETSLDTPPQEEALPVLS